MAIVLWCERKVAANFENKYSFSRSLCFAARARSKICRCFGIELIKKWPIDSNVPIFKNRKQMKNHSTLIHSLGWGSTADKPCVCIPMFLSPNSRVFSPFSTNLLYCKYILLKKVCLFRVIYSIYIFPISTFISYSISPPFSLSHFKYLYMYIPYLHLYLFFHITAFWLFLLSHYKYVSSFVPSICLSLHSSPL